MMMMMIMMVIFSCLLRCYKSHLVILLNTVNIGIQVVITCKYFKEIYIYIFTTYEINNTFNKLNVLKDNMFRYRATNRKVAGSIPEGASRIFQ